MDFDFLRLVSMLVLICSLEIIQPAMSYSVGIAEESGGEGSDFVHILPEYEDLSEYDQVPLAKELETTKQELLSTAKPATENIAQNMRSSCALKDKYLPGTLPGNRLPTFHSVSDAFEACKQEQDCLGMTYDPNLGKWALRSSSEPKDSTTNEVSMTKECVDAIGLPRFTIEGKRHCYDDKMKEFESLEEATNACENDESCAGIWDDKCDGTHFWTCENKREWDEVSRTSCIHRKNSESVKPDELNQFNPDVMLGDQPPEARMNQVDVEKETTNSCAPSCTKCEPLIDLATDRWCLQQCNKQPIDCPKHLCKCF